MNNGALRKACELFDKKFKAGGSEKENHTVVLGVVPWWLSLGVCPLEAVPWRLSLGVVPWGLSLGIVFWKLSLGGYPLEVD